MTDTNRSYSLYEHPDDIQFETDIERLKQEVFRQRVFIEQQAAEIFRLQFENTLLTGERRLRRTFSDA